MLRFFLVDLNMMKRIMMPKLPQKLTKAANSVNVTMRIPNSFEARIDSILLSLLSAGPAEMFMFSKNEVGEEVKEDAINCYLAFRCTKVDFLLFDANQSVFILKGEVPP